MSTGLWCKYFLEVNITTTAANIVSFSLSFVRTVFRGIILVNVCQKDQILLMLLAVNTPLIQRYKGGTFSFFQFFNLIFNREPLMLDGTKHLKLQLKSFLSHALNVERQRKEQVICFFFYAFRSTRICVDQSYIRLEFDFAYFVLVRLKPYCYGYDCSHIWSFNGSISSKCCILYTLNNGRYMMEILTVAEKIIKGSYNRLAPVQSNLLIYKPILN